MSFKGVEKYWWTLQRGKDFSSKDNIGWFQQLLWFQIFSCLQGLPWAGVPSGSAECRRCVKHTALLYYLSNGSCWHSDPCSISGLIQTHVEGSSNFIPFHWVSPFLLTSHWSRGTCVLSYTVEWRCSLLCGLSLLCFQRDCNQEHTGRAEGCTGRLALPSFWLWESLGRAG